MTHSIADRARRALKRMIADGIDPTPANYDRYFHGRPDGAIDTKNVPHPTEDQDCERRCYALLSAPASALSEQSALLLQATATHRTRLGQSTQHLESCIAAGATVIRDPLLPRNAALLLREMSAKALEAIRQAQETLDQYAQKVTTLQAEMDRIRAQVRIDALTGAINQGGMQEAVQRECARSRRSGEPLILAMIDLDDFRAINNTYGHPAGDRVLQHFAACVRQAIRQSDVLIRSGGEEFLLLLPGAHEPGAQYVIDRIRSAFRAPFALSPGHLISASFSAGICALLHGESGESAIARADAALLAAKAQGKNRNVVWQSEASASAPQSKGSSWTRPLAR